VPSVESYRTKAGKLRWRGRYRNAAGRKVAKTFDTMAAARRWSGEEEAKVHRGQRSNPTAARMKWGEWADRWQAARAVEPSTARTDAVTIRAHLRPRWETTPLIAIARIDVQGWVNELGRRRSASVTRRAFYGLSNSLEMAVAEGILAANPCRGVKLPTRPVEPPRFLEDAEAGKILYHLSGRWRVLAELLLGTGLRMGEATALHVARVDLVAGRIEVVETYDAPDGTMRGYPKSKARRTVPVAPELAALLQEWLDRNPPLPSCGKPHRTGRCPGGLLIRGEKGAPIDGRNFDQRQWRQAIELAGFYTEMPSKRKDKDGKPLMRRVPTVHPHDLRHTYASRLVQQGVPLERVQLLLGHEDLKTTQIYAHLRPEDDWDDVRAALSTSVTAARAAGAGPGLRAV
jgi:integrase